MRYLSQKFVERLCADDEIGAELLREVEAVIFAYTDATETLNASNFDELRAIRTEGIRAERGELREEMLRLIRDECALRENKDKLPEKKTRLKTLSEEKAGLSKQMPKPLSAEERRVQAELQQKRTALAAAQQEVAAHKQKAQKIVDIRTRLATAKAQAARWDLELATLLRRCQ